MILIYAADLVVQTPIAVRVRNTNQYGKVMKISPDDLPFLKGEKYSNGREIDFIFEKNDWEYFSRSNFLEGLVKGKKIVHVGFVDHDLESIQKKIHKGKWLHSELDAAAERCCGIDILVDEVKLVSQKFGFSDVVTADVTKEIPEIAKNVTWDYMMIPEVLEHLDNPVCFLQGVKNTWSGCIKKVVITVPNAFTPSNFSHAKRKKEHINTDHRFWFTPFTLAKVVIAAGLKVDDIVMCHHGRVKRRSFVKNFWFRRQPLMRSDIVMVCDL